MAINCTEIDWINRDYEEVTGKAVRKFVCPITLLDDPDVELCNGHVLNDGIKTASNATVVQRKDVDTYFGGVIEPDLIQLLNLIVSNPEDLLLAAREIKIQVSPSETADAFFANKK